MKRVLSLAVSAAAVAFASAPAHAVDFVYAGSWQVDDGPNWTVVPLAYTGQEAAALLFGGSPDDYAISTLGDLVANIDNLAWVSTWAGACGGSFPCGTKVAEDFKMSTGGLYSDFGDTSAYANDWALGSEYTNYAFRIVAAGAVPEPATWALMILGFGAIGGAMRARKRQTVTVRYA